MKHILITLIAALATLVHSQPSNGQIGIPVWTANGTSTVWLTLQNNKVIGVNGSGNLEMVAGGGSSTLGALTDVSLTSLTSGQLLQYNGTGWVNWTPNYQPLDSKLTSIAALANAAGVLTNNGSGTFSYTALSGYLTSATAASTYATIASLGGAAFLDASADATADAVARYDDAGRLRSTSINFKDSGFEAALRADSLTASVGYLLPSQAEDGLRLLTTGGSGANLTALNASNISSGTVAAARMPALTGDVTTSAGAVATTIATGVVGPTQLASTAVTAGSYTSTNLTVDADGRITAASNGSSGITIGTTTSNGTAGRVLYTDGTNVQAYDKTGSGSTVVMSGGPTFAGPVTITGGGTYLYFSGAGSYMQLGGASAPGIFGVTQAYEVKNGTQNVGLRVYNTETSATNYERAVLAWASNTLSVGTQKGSGGGTARDMILISDNTERVRINASGLTIASGMALQLGNTAVVETPLPTHTIIIKDAAGVSYRVLAVPVP